MMHVRQKLDNAMQNPREAASGSEIVYMMMSEVSKSLSK